MKRLKLIITMIFSIPFIVVFMGALLFFPAGNFYWINGWMLIASLVFYILLIFIYFIIKDPATNFCTPHSQRKRNASQGA